VANSLLARKEVVELPDRLMLGGRFMREGSKELNSSLVDEEEDEVDVEP
jgi:hypothetical protein